MKRSALVLALFSLGAAGSAFASPKEDAAAIEIYRQAAFQLAARVKPEQLPARLLAHFERMKALVLGMESRESGQLGSAQMIRAMKQLAVEAPIRAWSAELFARFFSSCDSFSSCSSLLGQLAEFADLDPADVSALIEKTLRPQFAGLTLKLSHRALSNSLGQRLLEFKLSSLEVLVDYERFSGVSQPGRTPLMPAAEIGALRDRLADLHEDLDGLLPEPRKFFETAPEFDRRAEKFYADLARDLSTDFTQIEGLNGGAREALSAAALDLVASFRLTQLGDESLRLYLERFNRADIGEWLNGLEARVTNGQLGADVTLMMLLRFSEGESYLPFRDDWVSLARRLAQKVTVGAFDWNVPVEAAAQRVSLRDGEIRAYLTAQGFFKNDLGGLNLGETLVAREKQLAREFKAFHSLFFQIGLMNQTQNDLALTAQRCRAAKGDAFDRAQEQVGQAEDAALEKWIDVACYAADAGDASTASRARELNIFFGDGDHYRLSEACPASTVGSRRFGPEFGVIEYIFKRRSAKIFQPFYLELLIDIASIPVTLAPPSLAGAVAAPVAPAVTRAGATMATKMAVEGLASYALTRAVPQVAGAIAGSVAFTISQKTLFSALTLGKVPIYDGKKTFFENYGRDLIYGSAVFFFLPYTSGLAEAAGRRILASSTGKGNLSAELAALSVKAASDTAAFTAIPYAERIVDNLIKRTNDPVIRGWRDFNSNLGNSAMMALAFKLQRQP